MEHLHHFKLVEDPFRNESLLRNFIDTPCHEQALRRLERGVRQAKGLSVLIGEAGAGKTMVVRRLLERLEEEVFEASMIVILRGAARAEWILTRFATQLGVEEPAREHPALLAQIYEKLAIVREDGRHAVLILDDAQALGSGAAVGEVCGLLKLEYEERRLLSLVMAGTPDLECAFAHDETLAHGADVRVKLEPLDADAAAAYLARRLEQAGGDPAVLDADAVAALHQFGGGLPGRMNTLGDNALFEAFLCNRDRVTRTDVERAHRDLDWKVPASVWEPAASTEAWTPTPIPGSGAVAAGLPSAAPTPAGDERVALHQRGQPAAALDSELDAAFDAALPAPGLDQPLPGPSDGGGSRETGAVFVAGAAPAPSGVAVHSAAADAPREGPPKLEDEVDEEVEGLLVELLDG